jgi:hypothetical protein
MSQIINKPTPRAIKHAPKRTSLVPARGKTQGESEGLMVWFQKISFFLIGIAITVALLFLTGAISAPQIGRYQMEVVVRSPNVSDVWVIDTTTGVVKWLDYKDEGKPFNEIKKK